MRAHAELARAAAHAQRRSRATCRRRGQRRAEGCDVAVPAAALHTLVATLPAGLLPFRTRHDWQQCLRPLQCQAHAPPMKKADLQALFRARASERESSAARATPTVAELRAQREARAAESVTTAAAAAAAPPRPPLPPPPPPPASLPAPAPRAPASCVEAPAADIRVPLPRPLPDEPPAKRAHVGGTLPAGFFDDQAADAKARGVTLAKPDAACVRRRA